MGNRRGKINAMSFYVWGAEERFLDGRLFYQPLAKAAQGCRTPKTLSRIHLAAIHRRHFLFSAVSLLARPQLLRSRVSFSFAFRPNSRTHSRDAHKKCSGEHLAEKDVQTAFMLLISNESEL